MSPITAGLIAAALLVAGTVALLRRPGPADLRPYPSLKSIAVLPMVNLSGDRSQTLVDGEVLEASPPTKLVTTWRALYDPDTAKEPHTRVSWEIQPAGDGIVQLTVVHDGLEDAPKTAESVAGGWSYVLSGLKTVLETGAPLAG